MSSTVVYNGVSYSIPAVGDSAWGTSVTSYLTALATGSLTKAGGAFTLTADANFGTTYGLIAKYFKSQTANIAATGVVRLANTEGVTWRNAANSADLALTVSAGNLLQFAGVTIPTLGSATFADNVFRISGSSDATKLAAFEVDGFTTATTRTFTLPNYDATLATIAGTETLTSKTLTSPTLTAPVLGTPASGTLTLCTGLPLTTGVTGTLPVANGGTGVTSSTGSGNNVLSTSPTLVTPVLGTPTSGTLTSCDGLPIVGGTTGTLSIARGGTGQTTAQTAIDALLPSQTSNSGKVLGTDGTNSSWVAGLSTTLAQYSAFVGNSSNVATSTNTALLGRVTAKTGSLTLTSISNASPAVATLAGHGLSTYDTIYLTTTGTLPTGLSLSTQYTVTVVDANTFKFSTSYGNALAAAFVNTSSSGSGTHTAVYGGFAPITGSIANAEIAAGAGIVDSKLATISTAGKVSNSATTATDVNTASAIVARDGSGNFAANLGTFTAGIKAKNTGSGSDTLSWYEEGTWLPTLDFAGGAGTSSQTTQVGAFTRIGRVVFFSGYVACNIGDRNGGAQALSIKTLPYTSKNTANLERAVAIYFDGGSVGANKQYGARIAANSTQIDLYEMGAVTAALTTGKTGTAASGTLYFKVNGSYEV